MGGFTQALSALAPLGPALSDAKQLNTERQQQQEQFAQEGKLRDAQLLAQKLAAEGEQEKARQQQVVQQQLGVPLRSYTAADGSKHTTYFTADGKVKDVEDTPSADERLQNYLGMLKKNDISITPEQEQVLGLGLAGIKVPPGTQMTDYQKAQIQLRAANEELEQAKFKASQDPNNPAAKQRLLSAQSEAERSRAYMIRAQAAAFGSYNGQPLPGALETPKGTPIGSAFSGAYTRAIQPTGQINDAQGAVNQVGDALSSLYQSGSSLLNPNVAQALAHHDWTSAQLLQGLVAQNLSPAERDAVTAIIAARENIQALRKASGGGISNAQIDRMIAMLPSPATPNAPYAARQLELLNLMIGRLAKTIPATVGGPKLDVNSPVNSPANSVTLKSGGKVYNIPIDQVDAFRKDHPDASR